MSNRMQGERTPAVAPLAPTIAELDADPRAALARASELRFRHVQLNAALPGMRPRELDGSARRGLLAAMRQLELAPAGVDLWIPPTHFTDPARIDRAVEAVLAAVEFAADLGHVPVSLALPAPDADTDPIGELVPAFIQSAQQHDVALADHTISKGSRDGIGVGIDPAACLALGQDPAALLVRAGERLAAIRLCDLLSDGMRGPIGESRQGRLDLQAYLVAVSVSGYRRPVVLDARQWREPLEGMRRSVEAWTA